MLYPLLFWLFFAPSRTVSFQVIPQWKQDAFELNKAYVIENDTLRIQQWKCYIQVRSLYNKNQLVYAFAPNHHLLNAETESSLQWSLDIPANIDYDAMECEIGVDSATQMEGVQGQDLDPEQDMYWSWQSGYIHTKIEATGTNPKRNFTLHIGGYRAPFNTLERFIIHVPSKGTVVLGCPIDQWMQYARTTPMSRIMKPGNDAKQLAATWAKTWYCIAP